MHRLRRLLPPGCIGTLALSMAIALLGIPRPALGSIDLTTAWKGDVVTVRCYRGATAAASYQLDIVDLESGRVRTIALREAQPVDVTGLDPKRSYRFKARGLDPRGTVVATSADEVVVSPASDRIAGSAQRRSAGIPESPLAQALSLQLRSLDSAQFPFIFATVRVDSAGQIPQTIFGPSQWTVYEDGIPFTCGITPPDTGRRIADIIVVGDNSGSMVEERDAVRANIAQFAFNLQAAGVDFRLGFVRFGQSENGGRPILVNSATLTDDAQNFRDKYLSQWTIDGFFEPGLAAILAACRGYPFRPTATRIFLFITDEDSDEGSLQDAINCCRSGNITVFGAVDCNEGQAMAQYCAATGVIQQTGGQVFDVLDPNVVHAAFQAIRGGLSDTYVFKCRSMKPCDLTPHTIRIVLDAFGKMVEVSGTYVCGENPTIVRTPETAALSDSTLIAGTPVPICAIVTDPVPPFVNDVRIYYRTTGQSIYQQLPLTNQGQGIWCVQVPGAAVQTPGFDYYLTASDGGITVSDPRLDPSLRPYQIAVQPNIAPVIIHSAVTKTTEGQDVEILADVIDTTDSLVAVVLEYHDVGDVLFTAVAMTRVGGNTYRGVIPGAEVDTIGVQYQIRATDNRGVTASKGPFTIEVNRAPTGPRRFLLLADKGIKIKGHTVSDGDIHSNYKVDFKGGFDGEDADADLEGDILEVNVPGTPVEDYTASDRKDETPSAHTGDVSAVKALRMKGGLTIEGNVRAPKIEIKGEVVVTGTITEADVRYEPLPAVMVMAGRTKVVVEKGKTLKLPPGRYDKVKVEEGSTLVMANDGGSGEYSFKDLDVKKDARLSLDVSRGPVAVGVVEQIDLGKDTRVETTPAGRSSLVTFSVGKHGVHIHERSVVIGNIIGPGGKVTIHKEAYFKGTISAREIDVKEDVTFVHHGSSRMPAVRSPGAMAGRELDGAGRPGSGHGVTQFALGQNFPNPFGPMTTIEFALPVARKVELSVFDLMGRRIATLANGEFAAGRHHVEWKADGRAAGIYFYRMVAGDFVKVRTMLLIR